MRISQVLTAGLLWVAASVFPHGASAVVLDKPVYDPASKSYYELVAAPRGYSVRNAAGIPWDKAAKWAAGRSYKGVQGRLAVLKTPEQTEFVRRNLAPNYETWIGLRFWCKYRKLTWVTGEIHPLDGYRNWGKPWAEKIACDGSFPFAGVYLTSVGQGMRWKAHIANKEWDYLLIEYPTGQQ